MIARIFFYNACPSAITASVFFREFFCRGAIIVKGLERVSADDWLKMAELASHMANDNLHRRIRDKEGMSFGKE